MRFPGRFRLAGVVMLATLTSTLAVAEVGVVSVSRGQSRNPYILRIIEDPDPVGAVWRPVAPSVTVGVALNTEGEVNGDGNPSMAYNPLSAQPLVVWSKNSPQGFDVVLSYFGDGAWAEPIVIAGTPAGELDPFLVVDPSDGSVHVVYWVADASPRVLHRQAPADLSAWSPATEVSLPGEIGARPAAAFHEGVLRVVYESHNVDLESTPHQIALATLVGSGFSSEILAGSDHPGPNWPQVHSAAERIWVEWIDSPGTMAWTWRDGSLPWAPISYEGFTTVEDRDYFARGRIRHAALE